MKRQITLWGTRTFGIVLLVLATQHWGMPLYKQYFTPKKVAVFVPTAKVREGAFTVSFQEIGTLEAETSIPVISEITGKIISIAPEGTDVQAGAKLVEMDTTEIDKEVRNQELSYQNALADVKRAESDLELLKESNKTDIEKTQAQFDFDETELKRANNERDKQKRLADEKLIPRSRVDDAELAVRVKELAVRKGQMDLTLKDKECKAKEQQSAAQVSKVQFAASMAKVSLDDVKSRVSRAIITAPSSGMVVLGEYWRDGRQKYKVGDMVERRQMVCQLPDLSVMQIKMKVGEADAPKVKLDQAVLIRLEAVPKKMFHGKVKSISPLATESQPWEAGATPGRRNFEVIITVKEADPKMIKPGMTADVEFICDTLKNTVYIPLEAVQERNGKTYCFIKEGKRFNRCQIKVGKQNDNFVCVVKGLKKGQIVALRDPTQPADDMDTKASTNKKKQDEEKQAPPIPESGKK